MWLKKSTIWGDVGLGGGKCDIYRPRSQITSLDFIKSSLRCQRECLSLCRRFVFGSSVETDSVISLGQRRSGTRGLSGKVIKILTIYFVT